MKRRSTHIYSMTRPEVEQMIRNQFDFRRGATIESISFDSAHLAPPQTVMVFTVTEDTEESA